MRIAKSRLRQIIREELQLEIFGLFDKEGSVTDRVIDHIEDNYDFLKNVILGPVMSKLKAHPSNEGLEPDDLNEGDGPLPGAADAYFSDHSIEKRSDGGTDIVLTLKLPGVCDLKDVQKLLGGLGLDAVVDYSEARCSEPGFYDDGTSPYPMPYARTTTIPVHVSSESLAKAFKFIS